MPAALTYPGVYIEEIPSGVRTITGVATSITAFVGRAAAGPTDEPVTLTSFADFERRFGGLDVASPMSYAVREVFNLNGGKPCADRARAARLTPAPQPSRFPATVAPRRTLWLDASSRGAWGIG